MANFVDIGHISTILNNPAFLETRLVIVSDEKGWRGYISGDGEKLFEYVGYTMEEVFNDIIERCKNIIES
jgi:hypothetical protein